MLNIPLRDYFRETRIFNTRLDLVAALTKYQVNDPEQKALITTTVDQLHAYVAAMPLDNFLVRPQRKYLDPFLDRERRRIRRVVPGQRVQ